MSMPSSAMARIARARTGVVSVAALRASKRSPPRCRSSPWAIWERAESWVETKSTRCLVTLRLPQREAHAEAEREVGWAIELDGEREDRRSAARLGDVADAGHAAGEGRAGEGEDGQVRLLPDADQRAVDLVEVGADDQVLGVGDGE